MLVLPSIAMAQFRTPNTDDNGEVKIPSETSIEAFHARLPIEKLSPRDEPNEIERDRALSLTLFGQGRLAFQHERYEEALAAYQRAWFWNPESKAILKDIPWMAFQLDRRETAFSYAILAGETDPKNPKNAVDLAGMAKPLEMLGDLGMMLAADGDAERGLGLVRSALAKRKKEVAKQLRDEKEELLAILEMNQARLSMLQEEYVQAARAFDTLADVVANPADYGMDDESVAKLIAPENGFYGLMAESYLRSNQLAKARKTYDKLHAVNQSEPLHTYHQAVLAFHDDDLPNCKSELTEYFKSQSSDAGQAPYELLRRVFAKEDPDFADEEDETEEPTKPAKEPKGYLKAIQKLTNADPANEILAEYAAGIFAEQGRYALAQELLEPLLAGQPTIQTFSTLLGAYSHLDLPGKTVALLGNATDATGDLRLVESALEELTGDEAAMKSLLAEADRRLNDKLRPMLGTEALGVALVCLNAKDIPDNFQQADRFYEASVKITRDEELLTSQELTWAEESFFADHLPAARKYFTNVLKSPAEGVNVESVTELLVMAHALDDETELALDVVDSALAEFPDSASLRARRGWVLYHANRTEEAKESYREVVDTFGDDFTSAGIRRAVKDARSIYSNILVEENDFDGASELLMQILDEYPEDIGAKNDLGYLWCDAGVHLQKALTLAKEAVAGSPDSASYLDTLAWAHHRVGDSQQALVHLERATGELEADDSVILDHLGDVYATVGNADNAVKSWKKAIQSLEKFASDEKRELTDKEKEDREAIQKKIDKR